MVLGYVVSNSVVFSLAHAVHLLIFCEVKNPCYSFELKAQALSPFNVTQQKIVSSNDKFPSHPLYVHCINEQHMDEEM